MTDNMEEFSAASVFLDIINEKNCKISHLFEDILQAKRTYGHSWSRSIIAIVSLSISDSFNHSRVDRCRRHVYVYATLSFAWCCNGGISFRKLRGDNSHKIKYARAGEYLRVLAQLIAYLNSYVSQHVPLQWNNPQVIWKIKFLYNNACQIIFPTLDIFIIAYFSCGKLHRFHKWSLINDWHYYRISTIRSGTKVNFTFALISRFNNKIDALKSNGVR